MVANIWSEPSHVEETLSTLRFASRVRQLTTELSLAESTDPSLLLKRYERQIKELKQVRPDEREGCVVYVPSSQPHPAHTNPAAWHDLLSFCRATLKRCIH